MSETVHLKGAVISLAGPELRVGDRAPEAAVVMKDLKEKYAGGIKSRRQLLITIPSLDTPVCEMETKKFNEMLAKYNDVDITIVSMDLPFAQAKFCESYNIKNIDVASDFRYGDLEKYGMLISEGPLKGLLARAVFIIDDIGKVIYKQLVSEISDEPDYKDVLKELNKEGK